MNNRALCANDISLSGLCKKGWSHISGSTPYAIAVETKSLEAEFRRELEGARTTCAEDAGGALRSGRGTCF